MYKHIILSYKHELTWYRLSDLEIILTNSYYLEKEMEASLPSGFTPWIHESITYGIKVNVECSELVFSVSIQM